MRMASQNQGRKGDYDRPIRIGQWEVLDMDGLAASPNVREFAKGGVVHYKKLTWHEINRNFVILLGTKAARSMKAKEGLQLIHLSDCPLDVHSNSILSSLNFSFLDKHIHRWKFPGFIKSS